MVSTAGFCQQRQGRKCPGEELRCLRQLLLLGKEAEVGQPLQDAVFAPKSHRSSSSLPSLVQFLSLLWWEQLALIPSLAKQSWLTLLRSVLFLLGCACNPQIPLASLYQHHLTTKTTPKPKYVPPPSKTASGTVNVTADAKQTPQFWLDS